MSELRLDLSKDATRKSILNQLYDALGTERSAQVEAAARAAGVPDKMHHHPADVYATIDNLQVSSGVKADMRAIYQILTAAEAAVHQTPVDQVHFHEVGRAAGIVNVAEICLAFEALSPDRVAATVVQPGCGTITCAHGLMPLPAPATAVILDGAAEGVGNGDPVTSYRSNSPATREHEDSPATRKHEDSPATRKHEDSPATRKLSGIPTSCQRLEGELVTPTSAAIIKHFVHDFEGKAAQVTYYQGPVPETPSGHHHHHADDHQHDDEGYYSGHHRHDGDDQNTEHCSAGDCDHGNQHH